MAQIGLCEDDPAIRRSSPTALQLAGHDVVAAHDGGEALRLFGDDDALDVIVLDIGLPDADGRDVCQALRSAGQPAPVLFLTALGARARPARRVQRRCRRLPAQALRREGADRPGRGARQARPDRHRRRRPATWSSTRPGTRWSARAREVLLTPTEFRMLAAITSRPGEVVRRRAVVAAAWPNGGMVSENTVDSYIRRIRVKLAEVGSPLALTTVRGVGYTLR